MDNMTVQNNNITSFNGLMDSFTAYCDVQPITLKAYKVNLHQFALWLSERGIVQPTRADIKAYKEHLEGQNFTAGTRSAYLRTVKHFFKWTAAENLYPNIADGIKAAKVRADNTKKEAFCESDIRTILSNIDRSTETGKRDYFMILLSVTAGLRIIEMQRADIQDLQTVRGQRILYIQGKAHTEKDDYVKLIPEVEEACKEYLEARGAYKNNDPLFTGTSNRARNERITEPSISRIIKTRFRQAGYDSNKLTAHSLRHTSNTLLFKAGGDLFQVQHHARHQSPATTEIYLHINQKEADRSEEQIYNQIFNPGKVDMIQEATQAMQGLNEHQKEEVMQYISSLRVRVAI